MTSEHQLRLQIARRIKKLPYDELKKISDIIELLDKSTIKPQEQQEVYQLHISICDIKPKIWRRILVSPDVLLVDLHRIIQTAFGWTNSHLHQFCTDNTNYAPVEFEVEETENSRTVKLNSILIDKKSKITYEYDFGDYWMHNIKLEKLIQEDRSLQLPRCIDGMRHCPPEDSGGIDGYKAVLKTIANPKVDDYKDMMRWLGGSFDSEFFNLDNINKKLKKKNFGCVWLE